jgi:hypothetical protein
MINNIPKGLKIEKNGNNKTIIIANKKELVFSDYFVVLFCSMFFFAWIYGIIEIGFTYFFIVWSLIFFAFIGYLFQSLFFSIFEKHIITITAEFIEIEKRRPLFSTKRKFDRKFIAKIDFKELRFTDLFMLNILIMLKYYCYFGYYKLPRILFNGEDIYILEHYRKNIRLWIVNYLNDIINE